MDSLFPPPSRPKEFWDQIPRSLPGVTPQSTQKLTEVMRLNYDRYHIFFNDKGFHKFVFDFMSLYSMVVVLLRTLHD